MRITTPTPWNDLTHKTLVAGQSVNYPIDAKVLSIENFQLAAHCVNNFDELVEALEAAEHAIRNYTTDTSQVLEKIEKALQKSKI